jgi:5-methylcytosine-specific restriction endonuclease McrA
VTEANVLVLNQNYEPLNVCSARRAFILLHHGKAEVIEHGRGALVSPTMSFPLPSVIRLVYLIKRPRPRLKLTRRDIFLRDKYTCQYCGVQTRDLTLDHVIPRVRGGKHTWENLVSACRACNHRKGQRTPQEAKMQLAREPYQPRTSYYLLFHHHLQQQENWRKFIPEAS